MEIPGYEILTKLGEGGTATVWKARQIALDRLVALKVLNQALASDHDAAERFRIEGLAAAKLSHRNIVQVFDAGEIGGVPYFAMEFVEGQSLGDIIARKGKLYPENALAAAESVAVALKHAWDRAQIIHCDIKPDNILVEKDGVVKVADLGLARIISHRGGHAERDVIGTPNYVSPEQATGGLELDYRSDIYSLGATLYHMVTGVMPFAGATGSTAMDMHTSSFLRDPMEINPEIPPNVAWIIEKMMVRDRGDRYATWSEVIDDLESVVNGGMPLPPLPEAGQSTVSRCDARAFPQPAPEEAPPPTPEPVRASAPVYVAPPMDESPNVAVNAGKMRAKLDRVMDKHQAKRMSPANLVLQVAITAAVAVAAFWMLSYRAGPYSQTYWEKLTGQPGPAAPPKDDDVLSADDPMRSLIRRADAPSTQVETPAAAPAVPANNAWQPVQRTSNELMVMQGKASLSWDDAEYQRAAALYNNALIAYGQYLDKRQGSGVLKRIEANLKIAVEYFEKCKGHAPEKYNVQGYIDKCNKLIFDVHSTMTVEP